MGTTVKRALISVSDKTGIVELARGLSELGIEIVSTGGTRRMLEETGLSVTNISDVTGFPEIMDGRVKTLHPNIHSGLLAVRSNEEHMRQLQKHDITPIDLVVVNLYPFSETIAKEDVTYAEAIENIDIGGPSMLRAAAKNHDGVTVVVDGEDYATVLQQLREHGNVDGETRRRLAAKVFRHTAAYDSMISQYLSEQAGEDTPEKFTVTFEKKQDLRYGENPHQQASFYALPQGEPFTLPQAKQLHGKPLSYNNINDADAALSIIREFSEPAAVAVKHTNPCGVAIADTVAEAYQKAYEADPVSIFGGIVALNRTVDAATAEQMSQIFLEIVLAPEFSPEAVDILTRKKNIRLLEMGPFKALNADGAEQSAAKKLHSVGGGLLVQDDDVRIIGRDECRIATERQPMEQEWQELLFAWKVVKHVKSNAIVLCRDGQTVGIGAGQMNRIGSARIAIEQAGERSKGAVLASDAFFPMPDTVQAAAEAGVKALIQPGGSKRDDESVAEADQNGLAMVLTGVRHFKH